MEAQESPRGILETLAKLLLAPRPTGQGRHPDPDREPAPAPADWDADRRDAWFSDEMKSLRECVCSTGKSPRDSVLSELAEYHGEGADESYRKCIDWEAFSVAEWKSADRSTPEGVQDFYDTTTSWAYDLAWYAYMQASGHAFPQAAAVVRFLRAQGVTGKLLDFGSGIGFNGQVFDRLGFDVTIADICKPLLDYAAWRNARHGADVRVINLNEEELPAAAYDVATAFDTLTCVDDFDVAAGRLHGALKPRGWLIANFDTRAPDDASAWHLQDDEASLEFRLKRAGFVKLHVIGGFIGCYQSVAPNTAAHRLRTLRDRATLPLEQAGSFARRIRWPTPSRVARRIKRRFAHA